MIDMISNKVLNLVSHQRFMKKAATIEALTTAIATATTTFQGGGI